MKKIMFYCPKCEKLTDTLVEIRTETNVYNVTIDKDGDIQYLLNDTIESQHNTTTHFCGDKLLEFGVINYTAEDFAVDITDEENPKLIGSYFEYAIKEKEKKEIIKKIKKFLKEKKEK